MSLDSASERLAALADTESSPRREWLDAAARLLQWKADTLLDGGDTRRQVKTFLKGEWLGHPLHPALSDVPIGAWTTGMLLDVFGADRAADQVIGVGVLAAVPTAMAGMADWTGLEGRGRRVGTLHAVLNSVALSGFVGSLFARRSGNRPLGLALSTFAFTVATMSAWLGGELVYRIMMGGSAADQEKPGPNAEPSGWRADTAAFS